MPVMKMVASLAALLLAAILVPPGWGGHALAAGAEGEERAGVAGLPQDKAAEREELFRRLAAATSEREGRAAEDEIWRFWLGLAPDMASRLLVEKAMARREEHDLAGAEKLMDRAVKRAPNYAEAWNQRAFVRFLRGNDEGALEDVHRTLELEPKHFGALSGLYHVLIRQGRTRAANAALVKAVEIHPWLKERVLLPPDPDAERPPIRGKEKDL